MSRELGLWVLWSVQSASLRGAYMPFTASYAWVAQRRMGIDKDIICISGVDQSSDPESAGHVVWGCPWC